MDLATAFLVLFMLTGLCFVATGCQNPGVPPLPNRVGTGGYLPHPGSEYSLSRDSNRYVRGFDHFCEFVGNDIGKGNLGCFVTFLVLLSLLCTYVVVLSGWQVFLYLDPPEDADPGLPPEPPQWHVLLAPWRVVLAGSLLCMFSYAIYKCATSDACSSVLQLVMMMPGASAGAALVLLILAATVLLPLVTDMWTGVTSERNPTAFFLLLPVLCLGVLFWGMSAHWVKLLWDGLTQKMWLRAKGYKRPRKPGEAPQRDEDVVVGGATGLV